MSDYPDCDIVAALKVMCRLSPDNRVRAHAAFVSALRGEEITKLDGLWKVSEALRTISLDADVAIQDEISRQVDIRMSNLPLKEAGLLTRVKDIQADLDKYVVKANAAIKKLLELDVKVEALKAERDKIRGEIRRAKNIHKAMDSC